MASSARRTWVRLRLPADGRLAQEGRAAFHTPFLRPLVLVVVPIHAVVAALLGFHKTLLEPEHNNILRQQRLVAAQNGELAGRSGPTQPGGGFYHAECKRDRGGGREGGQKA